MFQCNETGRLFEKAVVVMDEDCGQEHVCPCCGDTNFDEVFACDICGTFSNWEACGVSGYFDSCLCQGCRRTALVNLFEKGARELGATEEAWLDNVLEYGGWADLKQKYKEAKENGTETL